MVRKLLYLAALSTVATLAFASVAMAQYVDTDSPGDCSGAAEVVEPTPELYYLPDIGGCIDVGGSGAFGPLVNSLNYLVYDPDTGELLGVAKDLDPDLSSGANSVTYEEFCGDFDVTPLATPQDYYEQDANAQEQAILDPNGDGQACTAEDGAFSGGDTGASEAEDGGQQDQYADETNGAQQYQDVAMAQSTAMTPYVNSGSTVDCSGAEEQIEAEAIPGGNYEMTFLPDAGGCILNEVEGSPLPQLVNALNASVYDPDTGENLGAAKDLDPDLSGGANSVTYQEFCGAFSNNTSVTPQQYFEQGANAKEQAILDPDGDGLACTSEDEAFLAGDTGADDETGSQFEQTWTGQITQTGEDGTVTYEYRVEADIMPVSDMTEDLVGEVVGEVSLIGLDCSGVWVLEEVNEDSVRVEEQIVEGVDNCVEFVPITLTPQEDGSLEYYFNDINNDTGRGVLTLRGSSAPDSGMDGQQSGDGQQPDPIIYRTGAITKNVADSARDFGVYCAGITADTVGDIRRGRLPDTGGGWAVLLFIGTALVGGGWFLGRRSSR